METILGLILLAGGSLPGLAIAVPMVKQKLPWRTGSDEGIENAVVAPAGASAEAPANRVDPETVPLFAAVHLARHGSARWTAAVAEFNGHGPNPQSALPVVLPDLHPLTHVVVDPDGPVYYRITPAELQR